MYKDDNDKAVLKIIGPDAPPRVENRTTLAALMGEPVGGEVGDAARELETLTR